METVPFVSFDDDDDRSTWPIGKHGRPFNPYGYPYHSHLGPAGTAGPMPELDAPADQNPDLIGAHERSRPKLADHGAAIVRAPVPANGPATSGRSGPGGSSFASRAGARAVEAGGRSSSGIMKASPASQTGAAEPGIWESAALAGRTTLKTLASFSPTARTIDAMLAARADRRLLKPSTLGAVRQPEQEPGAQRATTATIQHGTTRQTARGVAASPPTKDQTPYEVASGVLVSPEIHDRLDVIGRAVERATGHKMRLNSSQRTAQTQAGAMYDKFRAGGDGHEYRNRKAFGEIRGVYDAARKAGLSRAEAVYRMEQVIRGQMDQGVFISRHLSGLAADIRTRDLTPSQLESIKAAVKAQGGQVLYEGEPPHLHIQFSRSPNNKHR